MFVSPYRTSVTAAHQDFGKRVAPDMTNRKPRHNRHNYKRFFPDIKK